MLQGRESLGVPMIVGSCGTAGGDAGLEWMRDICLEIAREEGLSFHLALVRGEQDKAYLKKRYKEGRIQALDPAPPIDEEIIEKERAHRGHDGR